MRRDRDGDSETRMGLLGRFVDRYVAVLLAPQAGFDASQKGFVESDDFGEHPARGAGRQAGEAGGGDRVFGRAEERRARGVCQEEPLR